MLKQILTFSGVLLLCACAGTQVRTGQTLIPRQQVQFFVDGKTQAAFKVTGRMNDLQMDGIVTAKKMPEDRIEVVLLSGGLLRVLDAVVTPDGVEYRYLLNEADNSFVRGRLTQLLDLVLATPGTYMSGSTKNGQTRLTYKSPLAKKIFVYETAQRYPSAAQTVTAFNTARLVYGDYMPASADGELLVPHELVYTDGKITLEMRLISLR